LSGRPTSTARRCFITRRFAPAADRLAAHAAKATGSASRVVRMMFMDGALVLRSGRGHRQGLDQPARRAASPGGDLVASLWSDDPRVIALSTERAG
jgi:feruloyl-CoA synthase